jgi:hypothetical protein
MEWIEREKTSLPFFTTLRRFGQLRGRAGLIPIEVFDRRYADS